jgi:hypothetical protein
MVCRRAAKTVQPFMGSALIWPVRKASISTSISRVTRQSGLPVTLSSAWPDLEVETLSFRLRRALAELPGACLLFIAGFGARDANHRLLLSDSLAWEIASRNSSRL